MSTETLEEIKIDERIRELDNEPPMFKVIMINDNQTPMEWVQSILVNIFKHSEETARKITLTIHSEGSAVVGIYTYEIAEQKSVEATTLSRDQGFPLQLRLDKE